MTFPPCDFLTRKIFDDNMIAWFHQCRFRDPFVVDAMNECCEFFTAANFVPRESVPVSFKDSLIKVSTFSCSFSIDCSLLIVLVLRTRNFVNRAVNIAKFLSIRIDVVT